MNFTPRPAHNGDLPNALRVFQLLLDLLIGNQRYIAQGTRGGNRHLQNRRGIGIELLHHRSFCGLRQIIRDQVDLVLYFLRGNIPVLRKFECDHHQRLAFGRCRPHFIHLADGIHGVFHFFGDLGFDFFRRGTAIRDNDRHSGNIHLRKQIDAQRKVAERAHHHQRQNQHGGEYRSTDAELSKCVHGIRGLQPRRRTTESGWKE